MRFYFNLVNGSEVILDKGGVEVPSQEEARVEAVKAIRELREEDATTDWGAWTLEIADRSGRVFFSLPLGSSERPLRGRPPRVRVVAHRPTWSGYALWWTGHLADAEVLGDRGNAQQSWVDARERHAPRIRRSPSACQKRTRDA